MTTTSSSTSHHPHSTSRRKGSKAFDKDIDLIARRNNLLDNANSLSFNSQGFEIPTVTTNGMKNIEQYINKCLIEGKQWYRCKWQYCHYSTVRSDSIVRHMRKHTGERPYKCFCGYATIQSSALKIHMRRHTGERPYICKYANCGKRFAVLNTLVVHERTHTGFKPFKCSYTQCTYSSSDRCKLVSHMRKTHQVELDPNNKMSSMGQPASSASSGHHFSPPAFPMSNGHLPPRPPPSAASSSSTTGPTSSSHSLALVSGAMSPSQLLSSSLVGSYNPFSPQTSSAMMANNLNHLKPPSDNPSDTSIFNSNSLIPKSGRSRGSSSSKSNPNPVRMATQNYVMRQSQGTGHTKNLVNREENSIKRVMVLVDKRINSDNCRTSYKCKWPDCTYESQRSDSIVRHIRSHTGERPYKCLVPGCTYSTIQRSTLNKHLTRHLNGEFI